jgi:hypothetical protein
VVLEVIRGIRVIRGFLRKAPCPRVSVALKNYPCNPCDQWPAEHQRTSVESVAFEELIA